MKTAKEWFKEELSGEPLTQENVIEVIKMAQLEVIEETVKLCAENAEIEERDYRKNPTKVENYGQEVSSEYEGIYYGVDTQSILNCAEILKKEL